ncbi:MAG: HEPN domain-containing protein [Candidatus Aenigmarchaeota archaeon]|nr:HEPN domain-containing protein [Candidatus Aenigmarchaeota archaeon]
MDLKECLEKNFLVKIKPDKKLVDKELKEAETDLKEAYNDFNANKFKWAIIKAYYSMFHAGKSVLFALGYKERKHVAVQIVLENLAKQGKVEYIYTQYLSSGADARESADYRYTYSKYIAEEVLENARKFLKRMKILLKTLGC